MNISVIIPTLNESENIGFLLEYLKSLNSGLELIVVDGQSLDNTVELAKPHAKVLFSDRGRGKQMNIGAQKACGEILWFLHADCTPHLKSVTAIKKSLKNSKIVGGAFEYTLNHPGRIFRLSEFMSNQKNLLLKLIYGDMGIFVRKNIFDKIGGYKEIPLMEDMQFCADLKKIGKIAILPYKIDTSARRWIDEGVYKNMIRNWILQVAWKNGVSPQKLALWYQFGNKK